MKGRCRKSVGIVTLYGGHTAKEVYRMNNGEGNRYGGVEGVRARRAEIDEGHVVGFEGKSMIVGLAKGSPRVIEGCSYRQAREGLSEDK